jgi:hypothetical protein
MKMTHRIIERSPFCVNNHFAASGGRGCTSQLGDVGWQIYQFIKPLQMAKHTNLFNVCAVGSCSKYCARNTSAGGVSAR